jgi:hypothetical protein
MNHKIYAGGASFAGMVAACFAFMLIAVAGESMQRRVTGQLECLRLVMGEIPTRQWPAHCRPPGIPAYTPRSEPRE